MQCTRIFPISKHVFVGVLSFQPACCSRQEGPTQDGQKQRESETEADTQKGHVFDGERWDQKDHDGLHRVSNMFRCPGLVSVLAVAPHTGFTQAMLPLLVPSPVHRRIASAMLRCCDSQSHPATAVARHIWRGRDRCGQEMVLFASTETLFYFSD
jgi:hypothetical protein